MTGLEQRKMRMAQWMCGVSLTDMLTDAELREMPGIDPACEGE